MVTTCKTRERYRKELFRNPNTQKVERMLPFIDDMTNNGVVKYPWLNTKWYQDDSGKMHKKWK